MLDPDNYWYLVVSVQNNRRQAENFEEKHSSADTQEKKLQKMLRFMFLFRFRMR